MLSGMLACGFDFNGFGIAGLLAVTCLAVIPIGMLIMYGCGRWIFGPLRQRYKARSRFYTADFFPLLIQCGAALTYMAPVSLNIWPLLAYTLGWLLWLWWMGLRHLDRAGINGPSLRFALLLLFFPMGYLAPLFASASLVSLVFIHDFAAFATALIATFLCAFCRFLSRKFVDYTESRQCIHS